MILNDKSKMRTFELCEGIAECFSDPEAHIHLREMLDELKERFSAEAWHSARMEPRTYRRRELQHGKTKTAQEEKT